MLFGCIYACVGHEATHPTYPEPPNGAVDQLAALFPLCARHCYLPQDDPPPEPPKRLLDLWANRWLYPEEMEGKDGQREREHVARAAAAPTRNSPYNVLISNGCKECSSK